MFAVGNYMLVHGCASQVRSAASVVLTMYQLMYNMRIIYRKYCFISLLQLECRHGDFSLGYTVLSPSPSGKEEQNVTGLAPGTDYTCSVLAKNSVGASNVTHRVTVYTYPKGLPHDYLCSTSNVFCASV